jgi:hypothetical protein
MAGGRKIVVVSPRAHPGPNNLIEETLVWLYELRGILARRTQLRLIVAPR